MSAALSSSSTPEFYRLAEQFDTVKPLGVEGGEAQTINFSETGICFETDSEQKISSLVSLTLEFQLASKSHRLECTAEVVRIDNGNGRMGMAARLLSPLSASATGRHPALAAPLPP